MICISGITGFVGSNLKEYLILQNKKVIGVSRNPSGNRTNYKNLNLEKRKTIKSFIHLAGKAHDFKKTSEDKEYYEVNTELTKQLFNQFLNSTCKVFTYMSSVKAVADFTVDLLLEDEKPNPITVYGKFKLPAES